VKPWLTTLELGVEAGDFGECCRYNCAWFALLTDARQPFEIGWKCRGPLPTGTRDLRVTSSRFDDVSAVTIDAARECVGYRRTFQLTSLQFRNGASISWNENHVRGYRLLPTICNATNPCSRPCFCISKHTFSHTMYTQYEYAAINKFFFWCTFWFL